MSARIPPELWLDILHHFVLSDAPTTPPIQVSKPELRPHVLEHRRTLWAACLVSRQVGSAARACLYRAVLVNSCRELLYLFRALRTAPQLQLLVRLFAWTGTLPQSDSDETECVELMPFLTAIVPALPPPTNANEVLLYKFLRFDNLAVFEAWRLLPAVLAMMPKLSTLFFVLGHLIPGPRSPQFQADIEVQGEERARLLRNRQLSFEARATGVISRGCPDPPFPTEFGYPPLGELQVVILDHTSDVQIREAFSAPTVIRDIRNLCPRLRYIQTKFPRFTHMGQADQDPNPSMKSLIGRKLLNPFQIFPFVQASFPNLESLRLLIDRGDDHVYHNHQPPSLSRLFWPLTQLPHLRYLSLTTPNKTWMATEPRETILPYLRRMPSLQHLRVDFIWLAERAEPHRLFILASFLPQSIKTLHLVDYWGYETTRDYPIFPDNMPPLDFFHLVLERLLPGCVSKSLTSLKEVKLSSRECAGDRLLGTAARAKHNSLLRNYSQTGIRLIFTGLQEARDEEDGWWLDFVE